MLVSPNSKGVVSLKRLRSVTKLEEANERAILSRNRTLLQEMKDQPSRWSRSEAMLGLSPPWSWQRVARVDL